MKRREMLRLLGSASIAGALPPVRFSQTRNQSSYVVEGEGPTLIAFNRMPAGYYKAMCAIARRNRFVIKEMTGEGTQYFWLAFIKP
jgi:hypothetical protein